VVRDGEKLSITDEAGAIPPMDEFKLAVEALENIGKPNPLAEMLLQRQMIVGQRMLVPRDMVQPLLGFDDPIGAVHKFELTLSRVDAAAEGGTSPVGVFATTIDVRPNDVSPLGILLTGEMGVETESCRLVSVNLKGPVQISSIERTAGGIFNFSAGGELKMAIRSRYDRVAK
jgi:hypothetical protein